MKIKKLPSQQILCRLLKYDPDTGKLFWLPREPEWFRKCDSRPREWLANQWNSRSSGKEAFTAVGQGYRRGCLFKVHFFAHRVIWKMVTGQDGDEIDHINGVRHDNRWDNLRSVSRKENHKNVKLQTNNTSGHVGIYWNRRHGKWNARIKINGRDLYLGGYTDIADAAAARKKAEATYMFHKNHGRSSGTDSQNRAGAGEHG